MRSFLFVPADSERKLARGPQSGADALILDLEDLVAPANRPAARVLARGFLEFERFSRLSALGAGQPAGVGHRSRRSRRGGAWTARRHPAAEMRP